jgi:dihydropteroate synthase
MTATEADALSGNRPLLMGIVNVTPDSFSDGGNYLAVDRAVAHGLELLDEGADIIDIGGESTRPPGSAYGMGSLNIAVTEELARVIPVIEQLHGTRPDAVISIDTMKPEVARAAIVAGASIINDVSAGQYDEAIWNVAADHGVACVLMHGHNPHNRVPVDQVRYEDVIEEVYQFLDERIAMARRAGVEQIIADVGIGFSKGLNDNVRLLREHARFTALGVRLLVGASRKAFIGTLLGGAEADSRAIGTLAAHTAAMLGGASILRVHDVRIAHEFLSVFNVVRPEVER